MKHKLLWLLLLMLVIVISLYIGWDFPALSPYVQAARLTKLWGYLLIAVLVVPSTIVFQTVIHSRYLSPGILGIDAVYVLIQSMYYFAGVRLFKELTPHSLVGYMVQMGCLLLFFVLTLRLVKIDWRLQQQETLWLMTGMILSSVLRQLSTFFQILMDPNEYLTLQRRLFPSFQGLSQSLLVTATFVAILGLGYFYHKRFVLDVYHLGREMALSLGVDIVRQSPRLLSVVVLMVGTATALVGPLLFFGFMITNITYTICVSHQHTQRIVIGILVGSIFVVSGQWLIERVFNNQYTLNLLIEGVGGLLFFILLWRKAGDVFVNH
ncbi:iron chelate uptake ABC transporter family permease subunit [Tuanshanicoccus lijuaniae]|uniref:iron chelate uptake ABC transporter family permease subunit n=1 Tax=Aerococcaceae bacterium zg-1292 TaxID=2774330 RepID=UPI001938B2D6|nr:iron chelate uptake ABC transporter family permease subunit [Aerococcaceae bacterium zg-1292]MBS4456071.1 iron chelate uptake ABC transporter family permease subunit [Aerococcaceae bacterium zg-A91]MBS4457823.1 iron chelate uptake ABC transporter family permease subunit [Aerococcaceae bacterium zg-BR33]QQA37660.1 iron chelate uptake ABC transporter family permease subunit [Aerococcaceae bacterium zg-1292]